VRLGTHRDDVPESPYISSREVKRFLKIESLDHAPPGRWFPRKVEPERKLRHHNAGDILATVEAIERQATPGDEVQFPTSLVEELKKALPALRELGETVAQMGDILDRMQVAGQGIDPLVPASQVFKERHEASAKLRAHQAKNAAYQRENRQR
jgi:hypothetical protein